MKKTSLLVFVLILFCSTTEISAQKQSVDNSREVLKDLNDTGDFPLKDSDRKEYEKINKDFADQLSIIDKSDKSNDEKEKSIDKLFDDRDKTIKDKFFKSDATGFEKYQKKTSKKIKKTKRKAKINLAKAVL